MIRICLTLFLISSLSLAQNAEDDFFIQDSSVEQEALPEAGGEGVPHSATIVQEVPQGFDPALEGFFENFEYDPHDQRDPFLPFLVLQRIKIVNEREAEVLEPLQAFALSELQVVGIIWDVGKPKALVVDPKGKSYIIEENAKIGKDFGYVAAIREGEVIIIEEQLDGNANKSFVTKILKIQAGDGIYN